VKAMLDEHINALANYCAADIFVTFNRTYPLDEIIPPQSRSKVSPMRGLEGSDCNPGNR
jgi:hypothetical protein